MSQESKGQEIDVFNTKKLTIPITNCKVIHLEIVDLMSFEKYDSKQVPDKSKGVYALVSEGLIFYIGKTIDIKGRIKAHTKKYIFDSYLFQPIEDNLLLEITELVLIVKYKPEQNQRFNFDLKRYEVGNESNN